MLKQFFLLCISLPILSFGQKSDSSYLNKKGHPIFPKQGDFSIGINAAPFIEYAGNMLSGSDNSAPIFGFTAQHPGEIYGKYFITDTKAARFGITLGLLFDTDKVSVNNSFSTFKHAALGIGASLGLENNRYTRARIKGFYGYEGGITISPYSGWSENAQRNVTGRITFINPDDRDSEFTEKGGNTYKLFFQYFGGMELFLFPKISLGGELGISAVASIQDKRKLKPDSGSETTIIPESGSFTISPYISGDLVLNIYF